MRKLIIRFIYRRIPPKAAILSASALILCLGQLSMPARAAQSGQNLSNATLIKQVPYVPTPQDVVEKMLELAKVTPDDVVYDLGSGDGRIVITAAQKFGAHAVGIEINPELFHESSDRVKKLGLEDRVSIVNEDMFNVSLSKATVVTLYLLTSVNEKLRPKLEHQLHSGTRIVCHDFHIPGWDADKVVEVNSENGVSHKLYLYVHP